LGGPTEGEFEIREEYHSGDEEEVRGVEGGGAARTQSSQEEEEEEEEEINYGVAVSYNLPIHPLGVVSSLRFRAVCRYGRHAQPEPRHLPILLPDQSPLHLPPIYTHSPPHANDVVVATHI